SDPSQEDPRLFARMSVRGLSPEQLFDSVAEVTEYRNNIPAPVNNFAGNGPRTPREEFRARFGGQPGKRVDYQTSILQALFLMNGKFMANATSLEGNPTLATIADAAGHSTARRVETLYLVALARKPREHEVERLVKYVDSGGPSKDPCKA